MYIVTQETMILSISCKLIQLEAIPKEGIGIGD
jgi:hypothetical protein